MKNSKIMCLPLFMPFECRAVDSRRIEIPSGSYVHYYAEMVVVREGKLQVFLDQEELTVSAGETVMVCPGTKHRALLSGNGFVRLDMIRFDPNRMLEQPDYCANLRAVLGDARRQKMPMRVSSAEAERLGLSDLAARCVEEAERRGFGYDVNISAWICQACTSMIRFWLERGLTLPERQEEEDRVYSLSGYIQQHLKDSIRVEDLAVYCGLSYPWFAKKFREIYGVSCKDFIEQIRVSRVEQYLRFTEMDLSAISEATGYADCSHMIKNFKRVMNITPGQYRLRQNRAQ